MLYTSRTRLNILNSNDQWLHVKQKLKKNTHQVSIKIYCKCYLKFCKFGIRKCKFLCFSINKLVFHFVMISGRWRLSSVHSGITTPLQKKRLQGRRRPLIQGGVFVAVSRLTCLLCLFFFARFLGTLCVLIRPHTPSVVLSGAAAKSLASPQHDKSPTL